METVYPPPPMPVSDVTCSLNWQDSFGAPPRLSSRQTSTFPVEGNRSRRRSEGNENQREHQTQVAEV